MPSKFFFFFFPSNKREPRGPRTWIILKKMYMFGNFRYLCQREKVLRESFKREGEGVSRERGRQCRDESTQAEIRKGRIQAE